jgi:twinfilin
MLYASSRNSLLKSLGSSTFTDSIFATSKADLTPDAYEAHLKHIAAPHPMTAREKELADIKEAERAAGGSAYQGSGARQSPFSGLDNKGFKWSDEAEYAVLQLGKSEGPLLVVIVRPLDALRSYGFLIIL